MYVYVYTSRYVKTNTSKLVPSKLGPLLKSNSDHF